MTHHPHLKKVGLKATLPRLKIFKLLEATNSHLSAEALYRDLLESGEDVSLATVYRVLTQFEQAGLVVKHHFENGLAVFELNYGQHHDHLVCTKCGEVREFLDPIIEQQQREVAKKAGFEMTDHSLNIYGLCHSCQ